MLATAPAFSQSGGKAGAFSRIGFGARGLAMGNATTAFTADGVYSYYNPALAAFASSVNQIDISTSAMSFDRSLNTVSGTFRLPPSGGMQLSILNANVSNIDGRTVDGYHTSSLSTHEYQFAATIGQQLSDKLSAGIGLKYYLSDLHSSVDAASTIGLDLGLLYKINGRLNAGITVQDLLASYTWQSGSLYGDDLSNRIDKFPKRFRLGLSYKIFPEWFMTLDMQHSSFENGSDNSVRLGSRYQLHDLIMLRSGWQFEHLNASDPVNHFSTGFSLKLPFEFLNSSIDYAFIQEPNNISYMHTFGVHILL